MKRPYDIAVHAARNRNKAYEAVIRALEVSATQQGRSKKEIAALIGRSAPQISAWLSGPSNWTLDTISDLLRAIDAEMEYQVVFDKDRARSNYFDSNTKTENINFTNSAPAISSTSYLVKAYDK